MFYADSELRTCNSSECFGEMVAAPALWSEVPQPCCRRASELPAMVAGILLIGCSVGNGFHPTSASKWFKPTGVNSVYFGLGGKQSWFGFG
jgi:hypothetical protein